jgi:hypothetical protein
VTQHKGHNTRDENTNNSDATQGINYCLFFHPLCCVTIVCVFIPCVASLLLALLLVFSSLVLRHYCLYFHPLCCVTIVCSDATQGTQHKGWKYKQWWRNTRDENTNNGDATQGMKIQTIVTQHKGHNTRDENTNNSDATQGWKYCIFIPCVGPYCLYFIPCVASPLFVFLSLVLRLYCLYFHLLCCVAIETQHKRQKYKQWWRIRSDKNTNNSDTILCTGAKIDKLIKYN